MFKSGGSAKTVYIQFIVAYAIIYMKLVFFVYGSVFIMRASSLGEQSCYPYQIAKVLR